MKSWTEYVKRGKSLVTEINDRKWELGDLANEVCPASETGVSDDDRIGKFADEIGISPGTLREYRRVASAWPSATRVALQTWSSHRMIAGRDDRFDVIAEQVWTYNSLKERLGILPNPSRVDRVTGEIHEPTWREAQGDLVGQALSPLHDPKIAAQFFNTSTGQGLVAKAIERNPEVAQTARKALDKVHDDWVANRPTSRESTNETNRDAHGDAAALMVKLRAAHRALADAAAYAQNVRGLGAADLRVGVLEEVEWIRSVCDVLEAGVNGGPLDSQLQDLLDAEAGR